MPPFALAIFLGAFLLFQVQPMIGKYILPWFGGSPGVWTTCLLFFQVLLLFGYGYVHLVSTYLRPRTQAWLQAALLALAAAFLPVIPEDSLRPTGDGTPVLQILLVLGLTVGVPYLVLSTTGPLMQRWFSLSHPNRSPYRLYSLSNVGSLLALLSYPLVVEPFLTRREQALVWSAGLVAFALVAVRCAWAIRHIAPAPASAPTPAPTPRASLPRGTPLLWVALPAIASVLLGATTNQLSQDIAVIPFLWVLPLALYLLSFILCFDHPRWYHRGWFAGLLVVGCSLVLYLLHAETDAPLALQVAGYTGTLFIAAMVCHGELYRLRPEPARLTSFYLLMSAGGALGGLCVAVIAPALLDRYAELQMGLWLLSYLLGIIALQDRSRPLVMGTAIGLAVALVGVPALDLSWGDRWHEILAVYQFTAERLYLEQWPVVAAGLVAALVCLLPLRRAERGTWRARQGAFVMLLSLAFGVLLIMQVRKADEDAVALSRNFYGTLQVREILAEDPSGHHYSLVHGRITHGLQFRSAAQGLWPTTYYGESSGIGLALKHLDRPEGQRHVGLVGLGTGTLAAYGRAGDRLRIYEINPEVEHIARTHFSYLAETPAEVAVVLGDARLTLERELATGQPQAFDLLALDAFSSDAIPVHLLTLEAMETYLKHLAPGGVIAVHTSNRYLDLQPVVEGLARRLDLKVLTITDDDSEFWWIYGTTWMLLAREKEVLEKDELYERMRAPSERVDAVPLWTDERASLLRILR
jgi:spermidine synthase